MICMFLGDPHSHGSLVPTSWGTDWLFPMMNRAVISSQTSCHGNNGRVNGLDRPDSGPIISNCVSESGADLMWNICGSDGCFALMHN